MMSTKPVVASFCATFLAAEMRHVYRQIHGLQTFEPLILTHKRRNAGDFPFPEERIITLPRPLTRELRRFWFRRIRHSPWQLYRSEVRAIESVLRERKAQLLHIWFGQIGMHMVPLLRSATRPCPMVVSFHGADAGVDLDKPGHQDSLHAVFDNADAILVRSQSLGDELRAHECPEEKIRLQRTGLPLDEWPLAESRKLPDDGAWHLVQTCRLIEKKGLNTTLRAFAKARAAFPKLRLTIAGDGPKRASLERLAAELGIAEAVHFAGFLGPAAMHELYDSAHLFVHPSRIGSDGNREGIPNSMLEAMATGMPVVATLHGGIPEAVDDGITGRLVAEDDVEALSGAIIETISDSARWQTMGMAARTAVVERFEQSHQIAALEDVYRQVIETWEAP